MLILEVKFGKDPLKIVPTCNIYIKIMELTLAFVNYRFLCTCWKPATSQLFMTSSEKISLYLSVEIFWICDALRDLVPFVQFKNVKNTHGGVVKLQARAFTKTLLILTLLHGFFSRFSNCINGTKSRNASNMWCVAWYGTNCTIDCTIVQKNHEWLLLLVKSNSSPWLFFYV